MLLVSDLLYQLGGTKNNDSYVVKHPMEKMQILVNYIAENMENNETDQQALNGLIYAAKKNIAETIINLEEDKGYSVEMNTQIHFDMEEGEDQSMSNTMTSMFLLAPETITRNLAEGNLQEDPALDAQSNETEEEKAEKKEKLKNAFKLLQGKEGSYAAYEAQNADVKNDMLFLENMFPNESDYPLKDARDEIKPGFFERVFRRTSNEFKNFQNTFNEREKGNATREEVDNAAKAYLKYKIPGYDGDGIPTVQQLEGLTGKAKDRALFCIKTLMANEESREYEGKYRALMNVANNNIKEYGENTLNVMKESNSNPIPDVDAYLAAQANNNVQQENVVQNEEEAQQELDASFQLHVAKDIQEEENGMYNNDVDNDKNIEQQLEEEANQFEEIKELGED